MPENGGGVSGMAIASIFAGSILAVSGIKGWKISLVTQDVISGKDPRSDPRIAQTALTVSAGGLVTDLFSGLNPFSILTGSPVSTSGNATVIGGGGSAEKFARSVLATIGAPQTPANINSLLSWMHKEFPTWPPMASNNPFATTYSMPGATSFNSVGVRNYRSLAEGILATARTLLGGGYSDVIAALRSGNGLCGRSFAGLSRWSGGGYSSVC